ncbi:MAG: ATP-grasp domain-containing protein [Desulfobacterales bacterium]|nr:ATP-grasp domain-containing protein [Desulfobacterales bacterium]
MKVGMTYDLKDEYIQEGYGMEEIAELDRIDTVEGIESALTKLGFNVDRIGRFESLQKRLSKGDRWDIVFNIAEGIKGTCRESHVPFLLELHNIPYTFSDSLTLAIALNKAITKRIVRDSGVPTASFFEVKDIDDINSINDIGLSFPMFVKPVSEGSGKGISALSKIESEDELKKACKNILENFKQPALVETYLPGREFTVGLLGTGKKTKVIGVMEVNFLSDQAKAETYSYLTKSNYKEMVEYSLMEGDIAEACEEVSIKAWNVLNCRDAGRIDLRLSSEGIPHFIEINPLAGLNPSDSDLPILARLAGISFEQLIESIMKSAMERM